MISPALTQACVSHGCSSCSCCSTAMLLQDCCLQGSGSSVHHLSCFCPVWQQPPAGTHCPHCSLSLPILVLSPACPHRWGWWMLNLPVAAAGHTVWRTTGSSRQSKRLGLRGCMCMLQRRKRVSFLMTCFLPLWPKESNGGHQDIEANGFINAGTAEKEMKTSWELYFST